MQNKLLPPHELIVYLSRARVFGQMQASNIKMIASLCYQQFYNPGELIIRYKSTGKQVYILLDGRVRATMISARGREVGYQDIDAGALFGELSAIDNMPRSTSVIAIEPSIVAVISQKDFLGLLENDWELSQAVMKHLTRMTRDLCEKVFEFVTMSIRERVYVELIRIAQPYMGNSDRVVIANAPTHTQIANMIGGNREAVTREMNALKQTGLIEQLTSRTLVVTDIYELEKLASQPEK